MKRRLLGILCLLIIVFTGCSGVADKATTVPAPKTAAPILCPWQYDVCAQAKEDGKLHYYFLSGEGQKTDAIGNIVPAEGSIEKWGDCCLVVFPEGQTMLIDCGLATFGPILVENLRRMGVTRLDHIVITHPHSDHQDGIFHPDNLTGQGVLDQFEIGQIYHRGGSDPNREDSYYVENVCTQRQLPLQVLEMGDVLQLGEVTASVLWPKPGTSEKRITGTANCNNSSIVIRFDYGDHASLFTGDIYDDGEFALLSSQHTAAFKADLLKAPHHGGYTSGSEVFLECVSPELAVITGFTPLRDDARIRYENCNIPYLHDLDRGFIHVSTDGKIMTWETSRNSGGE